MKLLCVLICIFSLSLVSYGAPTQNSLYYVVSEELQFYDSEINNEEEGDYIGKPCNHTCDETLLNVKCDKTTKTCQCLEEYPVKLSKKRAGCAKPSTLGDQCMYSESCMFTDQFSTCVQVNHNAYCQCIDGYHFVPEQKTSRKAFCSKDILQIAKDLPALFFVIAGVFVFSTVICFAMKLFVGKSQRYENSTITTRLLSTSEIAQVARSFRQSNRNTTLSRRGSRGVTVSSSRATAARAAAILLVSCHIPTHHDQATRKSSDSQVGSGSVLLLQNSNPNSPKSFSAKQFKRDSEQKIAARNRSIVNQPSTSSLGSFSSPKKIIGKLPHSSSLNNLDDSNLHMGLEKPNYSLGDELNEPDTQTLE